MPMWAPPTTQELTHAEAQRRGGRDMNENEIDTFIVDTAFL